MTDPISALGKFTPSGPNRDELLFATGRASARTPARWKWATGCLALTQVVTLGLWLWPKTEPVSLPVPMPVSPAVAPSVEPEPIPEPPTSPDPYSYLALMYRDPTPEPRERFVPGPIRQTPTLTAGSRQFE